ncbi:MAG: RNA polymerase sigma factor RpoD/SigA [Spirochaetes bacterium]|nr:RNA polymerase sigma factor RpoD/SigA [Spirochaetota bacterium]
MDNNKERDNALSLYLNEISKIPPLKRQEEIKLAIAAKQGDDNAKEKLVKSNLKFVVAIARKYKNYRMPLADLINEGNIGLLMAITKFDEKMGYHLITYAAFWIRRSIIRAIYEKSRMIRIPVNKIKEIIKMEKVKNKLQSQMCKPPTINDIAKEMNKDKKTIKNLLEISKETISIELPQSNDDDLSSLKEIIKDNKHTSPEVKIEKKFLNKSLNSVLNTLTDKEKEIIQNRFGLNGFNVASLDKIAKRFNVSRERIRQIEKKALTRIRKCSKINKLKVFL